MATEEVPGEEKQGPLDEGDVAAPTHTKADDEPTLIPFQTPPVSPTE